MLVTCERCRAKAVARPDWPAPMISTSRALRPSGPATGVTHGMSGWAIFARSARTCASSVVRGSLMRASMGSRSEPAAVDRQHDAGREGRLLAREIERRASYLLGLAKAFHGMALSRGFAHGVRIGMARKTAAEHRRVDRA